MWTSDLRPLTTTRRHLKVLPFANASRRHLRYHLRRHLPRHLRRHLRCHLPAPLNVSMSIQLHRNEVSVALIAPVPITIGVPRKD